MGRGYRRFAKTSASFRFIELDAAWQGRLRAFVQKALRVNFHGAENSDADQQRDRHQNDPSDHHNLRLIF